MSPRPYGGSGKRWDTPTDGISRKVFDRQKDKWVRKYVEQATFLRELNARVINLEALFLKWVDREISEEE